MAEFTVSDDILHSQGAKDYFARADARIMIGLRVALEMLGLDIPEYARRKPAGRPPSRGINAAFNQDQGTQRPKPVVSTQADRDAYLAGRKLAKFQARIAARKGETLSG